MLGPLPPEAAPLPACTWGRVSDPLSALLSSLKATSTCWGHGLDLGSAATLCGLPTWLSSSGAAPCLGCFWPTHCCVGRTLSPFAATWDAAAREVGKFWGVAQVSAHGLSHPWRR